MQLTIDAVGFAYERAPVLRDLSLSLAAGELGCLLGPSGCGKTTVLRAIAGFESPASGCIDVGGQRVSGPGLHVSPQHRGVGMVFQNYALFNHLTVRDNVAFGLREWPAAKRAARVEQLLTMTDLNTRAAQHPHQLSGGQRQRVALARALAPQPALLLLDEPFSNLDQALRLRLGGQVRDILTALGTTALLVTHDQQEAFAMADRVGVMRAGSIEQWAAPIDLYHRPASRFVAQFIGRGVFLPGVVCDDGSVVTELGPLRSASRAAGDVDVLLRPDDIVHDPGCRYVATVVNSAFRGGTILYTLRLASGTNVLAMFDSQQLHAPGADVGIRVAADAVVTFPRSQ